MDEVTVPFILSGVYLRPAFQMAVDDDLLRKNPFEFELSQSVIVNDSVTREADHPKAGAGIC